jgi:hypothetical protein
MHALALAGLRRRSAPKPPRGGEWIRGIQLTAGDTRDEVYTSADRTNAFDVGREPRGTHTLDLGATGLTHGTAYQVAVRTSGCGAGAKVHAG